jgi:hypothetical protein
MSFPFPPNPVDGQQVSETLPDGTVATAVYNASKNEWVVTRRRPEPTAVVGNDPIAVTPTADRQVITWDAALNTWVAALPTPGKLTELQDVSHHETPQLGETPVWRYPKGSDASSGQFHFGSQPAHLKSWDATTHWEGGATVFHKGRLWRATRDNGNVEPALQIGRTQLYITVPGEPTFGILPTQITSTPPPSGTQPAGFKLGYWLQYTDDTHMTVWKFVVKGYDPNHHLIGEWEGRPWQCIVWRGLVPPPAIFPPGLVLVWIHGERGGTDHPIVGQQDWALLDFSIALAMAVDVYIPNPGDGDLLSYDALLRQWRAISRASLGLPTTPPGP